MSLFITFEGGEGSGKTTQIHLLEKALKKKGFSVLVTREPGGTDIGNQIRKILLNPQNKKMVSTTELFLYEADRAQHVQEIILPALQKKKIVISDRYMDASTVYQGAARQLKNSLVTQLNSIATQKLEPHITFVLDVPAHIGALRLKNRAGHPLDRIEKEKKSFHEKIRRGYLKLAWKEPQRVKILNGLEKPLNLHKHILELILKKI